MKIGRREVVAGMTAFGAGLAVRALAAGQPAKPRRVDVHYHYGPPGWIDALAARGVKQPAWQGWSVDKAVADMDRDGVDLAFVSITIPGVNFGDVEKARALARSCNEFAARMVQQHPGRFGMFGVLPLPDIEGSLKEIEYALDTLKADGIGLLTSYNDKWLGDPLYAPVFDELNRRNAVIYTHPTRAQCCSNLQKDVSPAVVEYGADTTRAIAEIVFGGTAAKHPGMKIIFSHAGGTMPFVYERFVVQARAEANKLPPDPLAPLKKFYYDTAQASLAPPMAALKKLVPVSQILFGTDFPYRTAAEQVKELRESRIFTAKELAAIESGNAARLIPRAA